MPRMCLIAIGLLGGIISLQGQDGRLNLNVGGGIGVPLNPTADFAGVGGNLNLGIGENLNNNNAIIGQFMWHGLPPTVGIKTQLAGGSADSGLYSLTVNYRHSRSFNRTLGWYFIAGGGWYYRHTKLTQSATVPVVCQPYYTWWGFPCVGGNEVTIAEASAGTSAFGVNGGLGATLRLSDSNWKFYIESRYTYAGSGHGVSTQVAPVTFGIMYR